jgi:ribosomal protein S18 acetylase RimI-like enzyme
MGEAPHIFDARTDAEGLRELAELWKELHRHHRDVAEYRDLVQDPGVSWDRRLAFYRRLIDEGAAYLTARDDDGRLVGYAMVAFEPGADDTFETDRGIAELVTLVVAAGRRSAGLGRALAAQRRGTRGSRPRPRHAEDRRDERQRPCSGVLRG